MTDTDEIFGLFSKNLHSNLKQKINASIFVKVENGDLRVQITKGRIGWTCTCEDIFKSLVNGYSVENFSNYIVKKYRQAVLAEYFY